MKKLILTLAVIAFVFNVNAGNGNAEKGVEVKTENCSIQTKHPKRKNFNGKVVTRADYVKTSNPKRLHWNRIHERNNPVINIVINKCPKRRNLVRLLLLEKKAGNIKGNFHKQNKRPRGVS